MPPRPCWLLWACSAFAGCGPGGTKSGPVDCTGPRRPQPASCGAAPPAPSCRAWAPAAPARARPESGQSQR
eukprot:scaffold655_cov105-Isochrysis_galbana.AAC.16